MKAKRKLARPAKILGTTLSAWMLQATVSAQEAAEVIEGGEATFLKGLDLRTILEKGGTTVIVLAVLSFIGLTLILYLLYALGIRNTAPRTFLRDLRTQIRAGRYQEARRACIRNKSPSAEMALAGLDYVEDSRDAGALANVDVLREVIEAEGTRQARLIRNPIRYLNDIAIIAPMIGLFGTVFALYGTFSSAEKMVDLSPGTLASGIGYALMTTLVGLMVGIPARIFYGFFRNRATRVVSNLEVVGSDLVGLFSQYMNRGSFDAEGRREYSKQPKIRQPEKKRPPEPDPQREGGSVRRVQDDGPYDPRKEYGLQ